MDCQYCDTSDGTGPLTGKLRRVGLFHLRRIWVCDECWYGDPRHPYGRK